MPLDKSLPKKPLVQCLQTFLKDQFYEIKENESLVVMGGASHSRSW